MSDKKFVVEVIVCEQTENENMDSIYIKKTYEMCIGKEDALNTLEKHYNDVKDVIEKKLKSRVTDNNVV